MYYYNPGHLILAGHPKIAIEYSSKYSAVFTPDFRSKEVPPLADLGSQLQC